ncbi:hypothetical protein GS682_00570 [Nostoc sp. B(2019)]|nr:hypothetical protein [Nostoc sp. B(2019)]
MTYRWRSLWLTAIALALCPFGRLPNDERENAITQLAGVIKFPSRSQG